MLAIGLAEMIMFFVAVGICLLFALIWIIMSESRRSILKDEINRLKARLDSSERELFMLQERLADAEGATDGASEEIIEELRGRTRALGEENVRLKAELAEARTSLEEVYKALSAQN